VAKGLTGVDGLCLWAWFACGFGLHRYTHFGGAFLPSKHQFGGSILP
jgi:hypothetical protein